MRRHVRDNGLTLFFLGIFLAALAGQAFAGWHDFNNDQLRHESPAISLGRYVFSSEFGRAVLENWQSEYLQFTLYILGTVWLLQRGPSPRTWTSRERSPIRIRRSEATPARARPDGRGSGACGAPSTPTHFCS